MKFGLNCSWFLGAAPTPANYIRLAQSVESMGFNTFWVGDHVVMPTKFDESKYPYATGFSAETGWPDPYVFLATIAAVTKKILLGTAVVVVPYRAPVTQAQSIATLDHMSNGRFRWGVGVGWMAEEFDVVNVPHKERGARTNEYIRLMKRLWSGDRGPFEGRFFSHSGGQLSPLPVQRPHPPIIVGGEGVPAFKRMAELGDGLLGGVYRSPREFRADLEVLEPILAEHGRDLSSVTLIMGSGDPAHVLAHKDELPELESLGVTEMMLAPKCASADEGMRMLDKIARGLLSGL
jgi:probable F420-dependent oxidoreductase